MELNNNNLEFYIDENNNVVLEMDTFKEIVNTLNTLAEKSDNVELMGRPKFCCTTHCEDGEVKERRSYSSLNRATAAAACFNYLVIDCGGPIPPMGSGYSLSKGECD
ncbi:MULTISPECIES: hypothetical protein [unclassified Bacillus (in: firmicutes)]|uniref:hypothetical protein n=1 Tax=unclassified Bacillus (in: firmicutes) TaxID=185979 RepID=UPI0025B3CA62|nr:MULTISPECIES: hypothetical protein [unclassified Bacillus (in: firmicutes)]MDN0191178.1 hypothetical protein [Bacillus sp. B.PNR1]MDN3032084.1 hypothetical protein [Bacillus sp. B.PNR2]